MLLWDKKTDKKERVIAFVDYEHWYYSYKNLFQMKPNVEEWYEEVKRDFSVERLLIFGDFSAREIGYELERLENITKDVIHTTTTKEGVDKDFTDFIMLDYMYQLAVEDNSPKNFIIFTGDGHFDSVIKYLRNKRNKRVTVYGVKRAFSGKLKSIASSYVEMPRYVQEQKFYFDLILNNLFYLNDKKPDKYPTYWKTIRLISEYNGVPEERLKSAMDELLNQKYIVEKEIVMKQGCKTRMLEVFWKKIKDDGIWAGC